MQHVAIMRNQKLINLILNGQKTIESRWYVNRICPWDRVHQNDTIYFKLSGGKVLAKAKVDKVLQFSNLNKNIFAKIIKQYGKAIGFTNMPDYQKYKNKKYCILIFLKEAHPVQKPFDIDKTGFGISSAWLCIDNINKIRK